MQQASIALMGVAWSFLSLHVGQHLLASAVDNMNILRAQVLPLTNFRHTKGATQHAKHAAHLCDLLNIIETDLAPLLQTHSWPHLIKSKK